MSCAVLCCAAGYVSRGALFKATSDALPALAAEGELWSSGVVSGELQVHWAIADADLQGSRVFSQLPAQLCACYQLPAVSAKRMLVVD